MNVKEHTIKRIQFPLPINPSKSQTSDFNKLNFEGLGLTYKVNKQCSFELPLLKIGKKLDIVPALSNEVRNIELTTPVTVYRPSLPLVPLMNPYKMTDSLEDISRYSQPCLTEAPNVDNNKRFIILITKLFTSEALTDSDLILKPYQIDLLKELVLKKYRTRIKISISQNQFPQQFKFQLNKELARATKFKRKKRNEENRKFVFKFVLNKMMEEFYQEMDVQGSFYNQKQFYKYYFGHLADSKKCVLNSFFDPLYRTQLKNKRFMSINMAYIATVLRSKIFKKRFKEIVENEFEEAYKEFLKVRVTDILKSLKGKDRFLTEEKCYYILKKEIQGKISFRFPWTWEEANEARENFLKKYLN